MPELLRIRPARVLAIYAHPDDLEISCGGALVRWAAAGGSTHLLTCTQGDKGTIWNDQVSTLAWPGLAAGQWARIPTALPESGDVGNHPYLGQFTYFVDCIRRDKRPHNDLAACAHVHEVMFAIQESIQSGKTVKVRR